MKNLIFFVILGLGLQSCNFKETSVHPFSITGSWRLTEHKPDSIWQAVNANNSLTVRFKSNGNIQYDNKEFYYIWWFLHGDGVTMPKNIL